MKICTSGWLKRFTVKEIQIKLKTNEEEHDSNVIGYIYCPYFRPTQQIIERNQASK